MFKISISMFFLILSFSLKAQNDDYINKKEVSVQIITNEGKILFGKTRFSYMSELQEEIWFYYPAKDDPSHKDIQVYRPFEIAGFTLDGKQFISIEQAGLVAGLNQFFLQKDIEGKLKLFTLYKLDNIDKVESQENFLQKDADKYYSLKNLKFINFKKTMSSYVSDCPDLSEKIADKTYIAQDIEKIVEEYNGYFELIAEQSKSSK